MRRIHIPHLTLWLGLAILHLLTSLPPTYASPILIPSNTNSISNNTSQPSLLKSENITKSNLTENLSIAPIDTSGTPNCTYDEQWHQFSPPPGSSAGSSLLPPSILKFPVMGLGVMGRVSVVPMQITESWAEPDRKMVRGALGWLVKRVSSFMIMGGARREEGGKQVEWVDKDKILKTRDDEPTCGDPQHPGIPDCSAGASLAVPRIFSFPIVLLGTLTWIPSALAEIASIQEKGNENENETQSNTGPDHDPCTVIGCIANFLGKGDTHSQVYAWTAVVLLAGVLAWSMLSECSRADKSGRSGQRKDGAGRIETECYHDYGIGWHDWAERLGLVHHGEVE